MPFFFLVNKRRTNIHFNTKNNKVFVSFSPFSTLTLTLNYLESCHQTKRLSSRMDQDEGMHEIAIAFQILERILCLLFFYLCCGCSFKIIDKLANDFGQIVDFLIVYLKSYKIYLKNFAFYIGLSNFHVFNS